MIKAACPCGSSKPSDQCCWNGQEWHKPAAVLGLHALTENSVVEKCYMKELRSCAGGISGEHLISKSVILILQDGGDFSVSGLPWLAEGEAKILAPRNLTANCLCVTHNSALSPLDDAARYFFAALKSCLDRQADGARYLMSGHDLERWLLKTIKAFAVSGNLAKGSVAFARRVFARHRCAGHARRSEKVAARRRLILGDDGRRHNAKRQSFSIRAVH